MPPSNKWWVLPRNSNVGRRLRYADLRIYFFFLIGIHQVTYKVTWCGLMSKSDALIKVLAQALRAGGGIHSAAELAFMLGVPCNAAFRKFLTDCVKKGLIRRVVKGFYESVLTPPEPETAIFKIIKKLRSDVLSYISLESQLSHTGDISQIVMGRVTVMTKGRSACFDTPYGAIEFTHTKKPVEQIAANLYYDPDIKMYRARTEQAIADLKHCKRNLHMLEGH